MNLAARKQYTPEFKAQAVELLSTGKPVAQVAEELCISSNLLYNWRHNSQGAQLVRCGALACGALACGALACGALACGALACGARSCAAELRAL